MQTNGHCSNALANSYNVLRLTAKDCDVIANPWYNQYNSPHDNGSPIEMSYIGEQRAGPVGQGLLIFAFSMLY